MEQSASNLHSVPVYPRVAALTYPLLRRLALPGLATVVVASVVFWSLLAGLSFLVLFVCVGALWRRNEPPLLPFCLAYQWLFATSGFLYQRVTGTYPGGTPTGQLERAVFLSMVGFLVLVVGMRLSFHVCGRLLYRVKPRLDTEAPRYEIRRLFWLVILLYAANWAVEISPMQMAFNAAQLIYRVLEFRLTFLFLLFLTILKQREGYWYGLLAFLFTWIPTFASYHSTFSQSLIVLVIVSLSGWRPWLSSPHSKQTNRRLILGVAGTSLVLLIMALLWQGAIKYSWRSALRNATVSGGPMQKVSAFLNISGQEVTTVDWFEATESLASRTSSGVAFFSLVLDRVPDVVPHENGVLVYRALLHVSVPRFIYPEKPNLGSDSWLVRVYAGERVAGSESNTSVGLGYMAQFYVDFGVPGMFVPVLIYGLIIGFIYRAILLVSPSYSFYFSVCAAIFLQHFVSYEGEIAKMIGGLLQSFVVFSVLLYVTGEKIHKGLLAGASSNNGNRPSVRETSGR